MTHASLIEFLYQDIRFILTAFLAPLENFFMG